MTYRELYDKAEWKLEHGQINWEEFDEMTKPLDEEIRPHGEWKNERFSESHALYFGKCSQCGKTGVTGNFCMCCGADMREGDEK